MKKRLALLLLSGLCATAQAASPVHESLGVEQCPLASGTPAQRSFYTQSGWQSFALPAALPAFAQAPDWRYERVLVLTLGSRPTPGYRLSLHAARIHLGQLDLQIEEQKPPADALLAQMITQPCLLLRVQKTGWQQVRLLDPLGQPWPNAPLR